MKGTSVVGGVSFIFGERSTSAVTTKAYYTETTFTIEEITQAKLPEDGSFA